MLATHPILWLPRLASYLVERWLLFWLVCFRGLSTSHRLVMHAAERKTALGGGQWTLGRTAHNHHLPPIAGRSLGSNGAGHWLAENGISCICTSQSLVTASSRSMLREGRMSCKGPYLPAEYLGKAEQNTEDSQITRYCYCVLCRRETARAVSKNYSLNGNQ